ncbi:Gag-like protein [Elysia marginata]|uniref:Gag-like protein n=1 Tax=Elysia marginata TaxID=1093978 RepID=A0AAV4J8W8_9GAST|nr:Gag-like protein [Elysia marginata]
MKSLMSDRAANMKLFNNQKCLTLKWTFLVEMPPSIFYTAKPINDLSPIKIYKDLRNQVKRDLKISKCKKGLLVEVESENEVKMEMQVKEMCGMNVRVSKDEYLNRSKGVISDRDLRGYDEEELVEDVPGVIHARRMEVRRGERKSGRTRSS